MISLLNGSCRPSRKFVGFLPPIFDQIPLPLCALASLIQKLPMPLKSQENNTSSSNIDYSTIYIPKTVGEIVDQLGSMMLSAPQFKSRLPWAFEENIDSNFYELNEGLKIIRRQLGEEAYAQLVEMSDMMRAHFEADPEDKTEDGIKGRELIDEMTEILRASRRPKAPRSPG